MSLSNSDRLRLFASDSESWAYLTCDDKTVLDEIADDYDRLQAENQRLKDEVEMYRKVSLDLAEEAERMRTQLHWPQYAGLPLKGVIKDGKVEWKGVEDG